VKSKKILPGKELVRFLLIKKGFDILLLYF